MFILLIVYGGSYFFNPLVCFRTSFGANCRRLDQPDLNEKLAAELVLDTAAVRKVSLVSNAKDHSFGAVDIPVDFVCQQIIHGYF